ncbi:MAG: DUF4065 domain-containing protein [Corynebacterium sp.]|uniref:Panacea domain-containing protein n=1 Tax=Corynebacterium sp. TaxID=1720 RepID=UPI0026DD8164|nr:type II toxin-antitoxin system antitoxin SocA domain-containing protein [Corynebacterium sp.]MDO4761520.1 DUF4065 domain-containing protein [Corynebacterium sp.]
MKQYSARDIAEWFVAWAEEIEDAELSSLQLQKLLYYAKAHVMRKHHGMSLFSDRMEAWSNGPVIPSLFNELRTFENRPIDSSRFVSPDFDWDNFREVEKDLVEVWDKYGGYCSWVLRNMTREEDPWRKNFTADSQPIEIPDADLKEYFCVA